MSDGSYYYSDATGGFYHSSVHADDVIPRDAVPITEQEHADLLAGLEAGRAIVVTGLKPGLRDIAVPIETRRQRATGMLEKMTADFAGSFSQGRPRESVAAWATKAARARDHVAGSPQDMITAEAEEAGIDADALARVIVARADFYENTIARIDGISSAARTAIGIARDEEDITAALVAVQQRLAALAASAIQHETSIQGGANA